MSIESNLKELISEINDVNVELLAVSKTKPVEMILEAYRCGQRLFGENKVQETEEKVPKLPKDTIFHMIGHLQSNKVKKACKYFDCIQSVDSLKLAKKIDQASFDIGKKMKIYIEINTAHDENKSGFIVNETFWGVIEEIVNLRNIKIEGLMCIGAYVDDENKIRESFRDLSSLSLELRNKFPNKIGEKLSMGMSGDYKIAIEEGSTMIRVGSSIFGTR